MAALIKERNGNRVFERICRWNIIDYTIVSKNNRFVKYADSFENTEKYPLTYFKLRHDTYPYNRYSKLPNNIYLEDLSILSRQDVEDTSYFLEVNSDNTKVRLYREITNED